MKRSDPVLQQLGERFWPLDPLGYFAPQRAAPNPETGDGGCWFGDELPPSYQDFLNTPRVQQARMLMMYQMLSAGDSVRQPPMVNDERRVT
jgi:hypothetical protein